MAKAETQSTPAFDELYTKLEEITHRLEEGNLGLEASVTLYEQGAELVLQLRTILSGAELRIRKVQGRLAAEPATSEEPAGYDPEFPEIEDAIYPDEDLD